MDKHNISMPKVKGGRFIMKIKDIIILEAHGFVAILGAIMISGVIISLIA